MTDKKEIQCEYCTVRSNENKCKALEIEFHNCLNILEQKKCPIYKLKQQLQTKEREIKELKNENFSLRREGNKSCAYCIDYIEQEKQANHYKQALDEIEKITRENDIYKSDFENCGYRNITSNILDIINKAKDSKQ